MKNSYLFLFAIIAAVGNSFFAAGQKKASTMNNSLVFIGLSAILCVFLIFMVIPFMHGKAEILKVIKINWPWIILSGMGLFFTYLGFNLLYSRFGTSSYVFYAVLSIITTSIILGVFIFKERLNLYHLFAGAFAIVAIILYALGNNAAK